MRQAVEGLVGDLFRHDEPVLPPIDAEQPGALGRAPGGARYAGAVTARGVGVASEEIADRGKKRLACTTPHTARVSSQ